MKRVYLFCGKTINHRAHGKCDKQTAGRQAEEIVDFADFVIKRYEENLLTKNIQQLASDSTAFGFLKEEEDLYAVTDLKETYNA